MKNEKRNLFVAARSSRALPTPGPVEPRQLVLVDSLRRQLEGVVRVEVEEHGLSVVLWHSTDCTPLGCFEELEDAERHREVVIAGIVQAAQREARRAA